MAITFTAPVINLFEKCEAIRCVNNVYLIFRINEDDSTLHAIWDSSYRESRTDFFEDMQDKKSPDYNPHNPKYFPYYTPFVTKIALKKDGRNCTAQTRAYISGPSPNQDGGHAEEFFLKRLMGLSLNSLGVIRTIDIFISRIPCPNTSMEWLFKLNGSGLGQFRLPAGCGPKLYTVIKATPNITWDIAYEQKYSNIIMQEEAQVWVDRIDNLLNATMGRIVIRRGNPPVIIRR